MIRRISLTLTFVAVALLAGAWRLGFFAPPFSAVADQPIERIALTDLAGVSHSFDELRGRDTVLYFFASWCAPCYKTLTTLEELRLQNELEVRLLAVAVDDDVEGIRDMLDTTGFTGEVWLADEGTGALQRRYFGNERRAIPYVVRLDAQTNLRESTYDPSDDEWKAILVDGATFGGTR